MINSYSTGCKSPAHRQEECKNNLINHPRQGDKPVPVVIARGIFEGEGFQDSPKNKKSPKASFPAPFSLLGSSSKGRASVPNTPPTRVRSPSPTSQMESLSLTSAVTPPKRAPKPDLEQEAPNSKTPSPIKKVEQLVLEKNPLSKPTDGVKQVIETAVVALKTLSPVHRRKKTGELLEIIQRQLSPRRNTGDFSLLPVIPLDKQDYGQYFHSWVKTLLDSLQESEVHILNLDHILTEGNAKNPTGFHFCPEGPEGDERWKGVKVLEEHPLTKVVYGEYTSSKGKSKISTFFPRGIGTVAKFLNLLEDSRFIAKRDHLVLLRNEACSFFTEAYLKDGAFHSIYPVFECVDCSTYKMKPKELKLGNQTLPFDLIEQYMQMSIQEGGIRYYLDDGKKAVIDIAKYIPNQFVSKGIYVIFNLKVVCE